jgi:hypothetical protein
MSPRRVRNLDPQTDVVIFAGGPCPDRARG